MADASAYTSAAARDPTIGRGGADMGRWRTNLPAPAGGRVPSGQRPRRPIGAGLDPHLSLEPVEFTYNFRLSAQRPGAAPRCLRLAPRHQRTSCLYRLPAAVKSAWAWPHRGHRMTLGRPPTYFNHGLGSVLSRIKVGSSPVFYKTIFAYGRGGGRSSPARSAGLPTISGARSKSKLAKSKLARDHAAKPSELRERNARRNALPGG